MTISEQAYESFSTTLDLLKGVKAERGNTVLQCTASDDQLIHRPLTHRGRNGGLGCSRFGPTV